MRRHDPEPTMLRDYTPTSPPHYRRPMAPPPTYYPPVQFTAHTRRIMLVSQLRKQVRGSLFNWRNVLETVQVYVTFNLTKPFDEILVDIEDYSARALLNVECVPETWIKHVQIRSAYGCKYRILDSEDWERYKNKLHDTDAQLVLKFDIDDGRPNGNTEAVKTKSRKKTSVSRTLAKCGSNTAKVVRKVIKALEPPASLDEYQPGLYYPHF